MTPKIIRLACAMATSLAFAAPALAANEATAVLKDPDGKEVGKISVMAIPSGVLIAADLTAVPPGTHGFHIHAVGKCEAPDFKSAGGHFNPEEDEHGLMNEAGPHAGDMPNIHVPETGKLKLEVLNQMVSLDGLLDGDGAAIVIHEGSDDYTSDPAGDAGARIACGVLE